MNTMKVNTLLRRYGWLANLKLGDTVYCVNRFGRTYKGHTLTIRKKGRKYLHLSMTPTSTMYTVDMYTGSCESYMVYQTEDAYNQHLQLAKVRSGLKAFFFDSSNLENMEPDILECLWAIVKVEREKQA